MVDRTDLIEVVPILGSDITKYREEVHDRIILNAIHVLKSNNFTIDELNEKIDEIFEIKYPKERLIHHLEKLFVDNIEYSKGIIHITREIPPISNEINDLIGSSLFHVANLKLSSNGI